MKYADLELGLYGRDLAYYSAEMRFSSPNSQADTRADCHEPVHFDWEELRTLEADAERYGLLLGRSLFADVGFRAAFAQARSNAEGQGLSLRVRLVFGPGAHDLHSLRWETLRDPQHGSALLTSEHILFSRYLSSLDWRPVRLSPKADLRALVVIANPSNLAEYKLPAIDVGAELARAKRGLDGLQVTTLDSRGKASLTEMVQCLRDGCDILYLACHGTLVEGKPWLWLEDDQGRVARVPGAVLTARLQELVTLPRLVVLASCQSAGIGSEGCSSDAGALTALGPQVAEAGVSAVVAMQGNITISTVSRFMPVFFGELQKDGQIDRAIAVARGVVRDRPDWWVPVLFMRLKSGRFWYTTGFAGERRLERWPAVIANVDEGKCTPIVGPGLVDPFLGSRRQIAERWAEKYHFPLAPHLREDLPQVAQYLAVHQQMAMPRQELFKYLREDLRNRYPDELSPEPEDADLDQLITRVVQARWAKDPLEPHRVLAELPLPVYVTTNYNSLLVRALEDTGKTPVMEFCRWSDSLAQLPSVLDQEPNYEPTPERPLVYYLFGHLREPDSIVLTEDNYFEYLIGATRNQDLMLPRVRRALTDTALLLLGYQLDDWNFRVLFRSLSAQEGRGRRERYAHVAAQIDPEEGRIIDAERARDYLEEYFQQSKISIYWGSPQEFMREFKQNWEQSDSGKRWAKKQWTKA